MAKKRIQPTKRSQGHWIGEEIDADCVLRYQGDDLPGTPPHGPYNQLCTSHVHIFEASLKQTVAKNIKRVASCSSTFPFLLI